MMSTGLLTTTVEEPYVAATFPAGEGWVGCSGVRPSAAHHRNRHDQANGHYWHN
ncbi:MAG: hypothetical protein ACJ74F_19355 [Mycobacterium sp.]|jgi:hypothetical protein|uniref:hypothetical protein n=1 Tax=Mycobacterium sp. TaxID=1785 RepID=UPI00389A7E6F